MSAIWQLVAVWIGLDRQKHSVSLGRTMKLLNRATGKGVAQETPEEGVGELNQELGQH